MKRLLELFRRKSEPVVPEDRRKEIADAILKQLQASGMMPPGAKVEIVHGTPWASPRDVTSWESDPTAGSIAIKPPADAGADGWTWDAWSKEMAALAFPGWSPCRFAHRNSPITGGVDQARFVFGITQGPFGLWRCTFDVCSHDPEDNEWTRAPEILTCLTHLPSGMGMGIFKGTDAAAIAADTAIRTCPQLADAEYSTAPDAPWSGLMTRTASAWKSFGIIPSYNAHAHATDTGSGPHMIMGLSDNLEHGKPEKLS